jgi:hypothetical protein
LVRIALVLLAAVWCAASAQTVVEYGGAAGASANGAAHQHKTGKAIDGVWDRLNQTLESPEASPKAQTTPRRAATRSKKAATPAAPPVVYENLTGIQPGIAYADLIRRFGPPAFEVTTGPHTKALTYVGKDGSIDVDRQDDAVIKVAAPK